MSIEREGDQVICIVFLWHFTKVNDILPTDNALHYYIPDRMANLIDSFCADSSSHSMEVKKQMWRIVSSEFALIAFAERVPFQGDSFLSECDV